MFSIQVITIFFNVEIVPDTWEHHNKSLTKSFITCWLWVTVKRTSFFLGFITQIHNHTYTQPLSTLPVVISTMWHDPSFLCLVLLSLCPHPTPVPAFSSCRSMDCPWDGQSSAAECGQSLLPLIPAIIMGSKGSSQSSVFQLGIPLLYWAACIWSLSPTEKLPPLSQEPMQHPILNAHKCSQRPVLHVVAIYYRRGPQEG